MHPGNDPASALFLVLLIVTLGYFVSCAIWPFKPCRRCHGRGHFRSPLLRAIRLCPRCHGDGLRLRAGRRLWNAYRRLHRAHRHDRQQRDNTHYRDR